MLTQLAKRFTRLPMSEADVLSAAGSLIANPPIPDDMRAALTAGKYANNETFLDGWRSMMRLLYAQIAAEKTWKLQRQKLIHFRVAAATWIGLYKAVGAETPTYLWKSYVEGIGEFASNPESSWAKILPRTWYFAVLQNAVLSVLGKVCYATNEELERHLDALASLREDAIKKGVVVDRHINDLNEIDPAFAEKMLHARNTILFPKSLELFALLREFADRIETEAMQGGGMPDRWRDICEKSNEQLLALGLFEQLAKVQEVEISNVLAAWRRVHGSGHARINTDRLASGVIPSWRQWSGSPWVAAREQRIRQFESRKLPVPDEVCLHLALPPGWQPQNENEHNAIRFCGRWLSETEWEPPAGRILKPWREIAD